MSQREGKHDKTDKVRQKLLPKKRGCLKSPSGIKKESPIQKSRGFLFVP